MVDAAAPVKPRNLFGIKDLFTTVNVLGGAAAILCCIEGHPFWGGVAILIGWLADMFDGLVARAMGTSNRFGGEYDTIADHLSHIIAPAAVLFTSFKSVDLGIGARGSWWVGALLAGAICVAGSVRHARNVVRPVSYKGIWCGLPRTAVGFLAIGVANSVLLPFVPGGYWVGAAIVLAACVGTLTNLPFLSHHLARRLSTFARVCITLTLVTTFGILIFERKFVFDVLLFWMSGYSVASWTGLTAEERAIWRGLVKDAMARGEVPG